ncbi:unnamed protein product [Mytilus edulis]|uniref:Uncharacterized protein n=1 Tax=Mytilus edulis TaxID=6550 RepID=A0A8S3Q155_MYTED|nr:unnamed protein product [Mytilus edulis]
MSNNQTMIPEQQNESNKQDLDDKSPSGGSENISAPSFSNVVKHHSANYQAYSDPEPKLTGVKPIFIKESDFFGNKSPPKELWITHVEIYKALEHKIKPQFVRGIQSCMLLTEGITLRNKTIPLHSQNPYYQKDEWLTTTIRVKNIPLSADDGQIDRELRQKNIDVISINRERLRVDNLVTHCWTGDRIVLCKKFDKPLSRFLTIGKYTARNSEKQSETEGEEQQETTIAIDEVNAKYEESQQNETPIENDKIEETDEQSELTEGDDEDILAHSMSLNKETTPGNNKKKERKQEKLLTSLQKRKDKSVTPLNNRHQNQQKQTKIHHQLNLTFRNF